MPSQNSTGGKASLGRITKRGDDDLCTLLIQGAKSAVMSARRRCDRISQWLVQLKQRVGWQKAVVALANKNARILWAVLTRDVAFDPDHAPQSPAARRRCQAQVRPVAGEIDNSPVPESTRANGALPSGSYRGPRSNRQKARLQMGSLVLVGEHRQVPSSSEGEPNTADQEEVSPAGSTGSPCRG